MPNTYIIYKFIYIYIYIHSHTHMHTHAHAHAHVCTHTCAHTHTCTHTTHTHTISEAKLVLFEQNMKIIVSSRKHILIFSQIGYTRFMVKLTITSFVCLCSQRTSRHELFTPPAIGVATAEESKKFKVSYVLSDLEISKF